GPAQTFDEPTWTARTPRGGYASQTEQQHLSADGEWFLAGRRGQARLWDTATGRLVGTFPYRGALNKVWLDPARSRLALEASHRDETTKQDQHEITFYDVDRGRPSGTRALESATASWYNP